MPYISINPASGEQLAHFDSQTESTWRPALAETHAVAQQWARTPFSQRAACMERLAGLLRQKRENLARLITQEMGKLLREALAEVDKCALGCDYYSVHGEPFLRAEVIPSDAVESYVRYEPLGVVLAVMPWNFPFWQVFRFAAPALMAGNGAVLKHASNVPQCAQAIEALFVEAGFPVGLFRNLFVDAADVATLIASPQIAAVTLTGSELAGRSVAAAAGLALKKCVLELGGSDPFIVLADADLEQASTVAVQSRFLNGGQSCIAAKRFILVPEIADAFVELFAAKAANLKPGNPLDETTTLPPMARPDLLTQLHAQVVRSVELGAVIRLGGAPLAGAGNFYAPTILDHVQAGMPAYHEELFGPVAAVLRAQDEGDAVRLANDTRFGLGASIWSADTVRAEKLARQIQSGSVFINGLVKSDPRLPFGGIKDSGYGRELSYHGIREFVNAKTVWVR